MLSIHELKTLASIGSSALMFKRPKDAECIFKSIMPFCPLPSNGPVIGLAMSIFAQGMNEEAIRTLEKYALSANPKCSDTNAHIALVLRSSGGIAESHEYVNNARSNCSDSELLELLEKIENGYFDA